MVHVLSLQVSHHNSLLGPVGPNYVKGMKIRRMKLITIIIVNVILSIALRFHFRGKFI
jgi:hypothetical protein